MKALQLWWNTNENRDMLQRSEMINPYLRLRVVYLRRSIEANL